MNIKFDKLFKSDFDKFIIGKKKDNNKKNTKFLFLSIIFKWKQKNFKTTKKILFF